MTLTPDSDPIPEDEANEREYAQVDEDEFGTLDESLISFWLSGPNERLSPNDQSDEEPTSSGHSIVLSLCKEPRRRFTRKEKGKK